MGIQFQGGEKRYLQAGLAGALGTVEVTPLDLTSAFGTLANGGVHVPPRMILEVRGPDGSLVWKAPKPDREKAVSGGTAFLISDILQGNSDPRVNKAWGPVLETTGPGGKRRPIAAKTGTAQDARDLATYGYLAPPKDENKPGLAVGIWMGNSDHSLPARGQAGDLAHVGSASVARVRRGVHEEVADRQVPAPEQGRDGNDRRLVGREAGSVDPRDAQGVLRPRDAADGAERRRRGRPPLLRELWRLACRPRQG